MILIEKTISLQHFLIGIFAVANNFPAIGPFLQICQGLSRKDQLRLCKTATLTSFIVMLVALAFGRELLDFFGISIAAFRIAGGLLLGVSGINMLNSKPDDENQVHNPSSYSKVISLAVIPIAIPLTTGAGTFSTIIIYADEVGLNFARLSSLVLAILIITVLIYLIFKYSMKLLDFLGGIGMNVLIKVLGLFTLAIGTQFIILGLIVAFPALSS